MTLRAPWLVALAVAALCGCRGPSLAQTTIEPATIFKSGNCAGLSEPGATWIANDEMWQATFRRITSLRGNPPPPPAVDFARERVLLIAMGSRPTGGFELDSAATPASLEHGTLTVHVEWREPPADAFVTEALTSPCLLMKLPADAYARIEIIDQSGQLRAALAL